MRAALDRAVRGLAPHCGIWQCNLMIWLALVSALVSSPLAAGQSAESVILTSGFGDATPETYRSPNVRPFEPPSNFGRERAEGDEDAEVHRGPLEASVAVSDYSGEYEYSPTGAETAYDQGVSQAEIHADETAGPLDGRWRVKDVDGRSLLSLALTDLGGGRQVEGAWRRLDLEADLSRSGIAGPARTNGRLVVLPYQEGELRLEPKGRGWVGELIEDGVSHPVEVSRIG